MRRAQTLTSTSSPFIIFEDGSSIDGDDPSASDDSHSSNSNPITISISYISSNSDSSNDLITTLNHDKGADTNLFDYYNPTSQVNIKQVSISAKDAAGNPSAPLSISIQMTDSTPPVIIKKNISIPFASTGIESYNLSFKDNSGLTGTCSGLDNKVVDTSIAGPYKVTFTAADNSQPKNIATYEIGSDSYKLTVQNPRERYTGGNCFFNGTFQGTNHPTVQGPEGLTALSPTNWNLCNWDDTDQSSGARWKWVGFLGSSGTKSITGTTMADDGQANEAICGLIKGSSGRTAYMTCGCWNIATSTWISNVAVGIYYNAAGSETGANVDGVLYNSVTYSLNYKSVTFLFDRGDNLEEGAKRHVTLTKTAGSGSFENESKLEVSYTAGNSDCSEERSISAFMNNANHSAWKTREGTFTVSGGNITSYRIHYGVQNVSDNGDDFGSLVSDIRIEPVKWKERETAGGEVRTRTYDISSKTFGWE